MTRPTSYSTAEIRPRRSKIVIGIEHDFGSEPDLRFESDDIDLREATLGLPVPIDDFVDAVSGPALLLRRRTRDGPGTRILPRPLSTAEGSASEHSATEAVDRYSLNSAPERAGWRQEYEDDEVQCLGAGHVIDLS